MHVIRMSDKNFGSRLRGRLILLVWDYHDLQPTHCPAFSTARQRRRHYPPAHKSIIAVHLVILPTVKDRIS